MKRFLLLCLSILVVASCQADDSGKPQFESYDGPPLTIAVVGTKPTIKEERSITFVPMDFEDLKEIDPFDFDAVFIMKKHLQKAAEREYAELYKTTDLPFFFIGSEKIPYAYYNADSTYESAPSLSNSEYAVGYYAQEDGHLHWGFGLYNQEMSQENILDVYNRMFTTISELQRKKDSSSTSLSPTIQTLKAQMKRAHASNDAC
ncbi:hypothetical protein [Alkalihalobacillus sp. CinArs1]|uniref:hypothetical protein n=1 Tax=Alkalihalobacillus sp. CinArs1 TaxID=2995314 RepID=UPI0022DE176F|nr:hypothetical protein [Alkalihalobacillus sp. CinArs1]